jgi:hypothetical protein
VSERKYVTLCRCPVHSSIVDGRLMGYWSLCLDDEDGTGTRLTRGKCCGRWETVKRWPLDQVNIDELIEAKEGGKG